MKKKNLTKLSREEIESLSLEERRKFYRALLESVRWEIPKGLLPVSPEKKPGQN